MRFTSCIPALDMLTMPLVSLSKPVGPFNEKVALMRNLIELNPALGGIHYLIFFFNEHLTLKRIAKIPKSLCTGRNPRNFEQNLYQIL